MRILILEDDNVRVKFFIEKLGQYSPKITENAEIAISYLKEDTFDYVFLDNDLGRGNGEGIDVADYLQQNPDNPNCKAAVIVHSWNIPAANTIKSKFPAAVISRYLTDNFLKLVLDI